MSEEEGGIANLYNLDSSSGEEDNENHAEDNEQSDKVVSTFTMKDFELLKSKTVDLIDVEWKLNRNKELVAKMISLEEPTITPQVCAHFLRRKEYHF
jgi:hypothetical protein